MAKNAASVIASAQMYREVVKEKEELEHVIESVYAGIIMVHYSGKVMQMNPSARQMLGMKEDDKLVGDFHQCIASVPVVNVLKRALEEGTDVQEEISMPDHASEEEDAERIYQVQTALVKSEDQSNIGIVAIFNDITDIRSIERMKTAFVSTVSHELRTPLTSIKGFISTLLQDTEGFYDKDTVHEFYTIIDQECDRLTRLISDLLNVSRIEAGRALDLNPVPVEIGEVVDKVIAAQKSYTSKHEFKVDLDSNIPTIVADRDKVDQILTNLTNNAVKSLAQRRYHYGERPHIGRPDKNGRRRPGNGDFQGTPGKGVRSVPPHRQPRHPQSRRHRDRALPGQAPCGGPRRKDLGRERGGQRLAVHLRVRLSARRSSRTRWLLSCSLPPPAQPRPE